MSYEKLAIYRLRLRNWRHTLFSSSNPAKDTGVCLFVFCLPVVHCFVSRENRPLSFLNDSLFIIERLNEDDRLLWVIQYFGNKMLSRSWFVAIFTHQFSWSWTIDWIPTISSLTLAKLLPLKTIQFTALKTSQPLASYKLANVYLACSNQNLHGNSKARWKICPP